jgi:predicted DCC family thiol-disulfide oxidoreductase YuxK
MKMRRHRAANQLTPESDLVVLYDGVCGLCNRLVQFLLQHDKYDRLKFASLQSDFARTALTRHGADASDLDTIQIIENYGQTDERLFSRSDAILRAGKALGGFWKFASGIGGYLPKGLRDSFYRSVARNRYSLFGKYDTCLMPEPRYRKKFLDM